jgi:hypothetical protein
VTEGDACVGPSPDGWTQVTMMQAGPIRIAAQVGLDTLAGGGGQGSCNLSPSP